MFNPLFRILFSRYRVKTSISPDNMTVIMTSWRFFNCLFAMERFIDGHQCVSREQDRILSFFSYCARVYGTITVILCTNTHTHSPSSPGLRMLPRRHIRVPLKTVNLNFAGCASFAVGIKNIGPKGWRRARCTQAFEMYKTGNDRWNRSLKKILLISFNFFQLDSRDALF